MHVGVTRQEDRRRDVRPSPTLRPERGRRPPGFDEHARSTAIEEKRVNMTEDAVVNPVVKQVGAPGHRSTSVARATVVEKWRTQQAPQNREPGQQIGQPGEAGRVLVVERKAVRRESVRPARQRRARREERRDQEGGTDRMGIHPAIGAGPASDSGELRIFAVRETCAPAPSSVVSPSRNQDGR